MSSPEIMAMVLIQERERQIQQHIEEERIRRALAERRERPERPERAGRGSGWKCAWAIASGVLRSRCRWPALWRNKPQPGVNAASANWCEG